MPRLLSLVILATATVGAQPWHDDAEFLKRYAGVLESVERYAVARTYGVAEELVRQLIGLEHMKAHPDLRATALSRLARLYALDGKVKEAIAALREAVRYGFSDWRYVRENPDLAAIRREPDYEDILSRMRPPAVADTLSPASPYSDRLDEADRIAGLSRIWAEVKSSFVWFDNVPDLGWDALYLSYIPKVRAAPNTLAYYRLLQEFVARLRDGHTYVTLPQRLRDQFCCTPGISTALIEGKAIVTAIEAYPPRRQGLHPGDEIVAIDGTPVGQYAAERIVPFQSASTRQCLEWVVYSRSLLAGPVSSAVQIKLADGSLHRLIRQRAAASPVPPFQFRLLPGNTGYIALHSFQDARVADDFLASFNEIAATDALIIDLRRNTGGNENYARRILACFFNRPFATSVRATRKNVAYERAQGKVYEWTVWPQGPIPPNGSKYYPNPVFILTSPRTGSAAEDFLLSFDIEKRATIIGEPTAGSTGQPLMFALPGGGTAAICTSKAWYPDGRDFVGIGIQPQIRIDPTIEDVRTGRDRVMEAALKAATKGRPITPPVTAGR